MNRVRVARAAATVVTALVVTALVLGAAAAPASSAPRQDRPEPAVALEITEVSPWVAPDGTFRVGFAPAIVPLDAEFTYTIHQRLQPGDGQSLRTSLDEIIDGGSPGRVLQSPVTRSVLTLGNPAEGMTLDVPVRAGRGDSDAALLPTAGIHPVELELTSADGEELWSQVVFLNRLPVSPRAAAEAGQVSVTLLLPIDTGPAIGSDGAPQLSLEERAGVSSTQALYLGLPEVPFTLALRPDTLVALQASDDPIDRRFVAALADPRRRPAARLPFVRLDTGGLVTSLAEDELLQQVATGDRILTGATGRSTESSSWYLDDTVTPEVLPLLDGLGVTRLVVSADRLRLPGDLPAETAWTRALALQSAGSGTVTAYDSMLTIRMAASGDQPGLAAHHVASDLMASWFTATEEGPGSFPGPASVILVSSATDPAVLEALAPALEGDGPLTARPEDIPSGGAEVDGEEVTAALGPLTPPDLRSAVASVQRVRERIASYSSMTDQADPAIEAWTLQNDQSMSSAVDQAGRAAVGASILRSIDERVAAIQAPRPRRVVLTGQDATIPLRFRNDLPYEVRLVMRTRSPRLEIRGGETREVVLQPGENRIDLPVQVRAPGPSLLRIELRSPDGTIRIPTEAVPVTSSRISGVGAALSVVSLVFLVLWWIRTHRRRRRDRTRTSGRHPSDDGGATDGDDPPDGADRGPVGPVRTGSVGPGG